MAYPRQPLLPRLMARRRLDGDCWIYTGTLNPEGYGHMSHQNRVQPVHRLAYEALVGPIPQGLHIDHLCRRRSCFNPGHLEPVTVRENLLRGEGPPAVFARRENCDKGHPFDQVNTLVRGDRGGRKCRACHREYMRAWRAQRVS